MPIEPQLFVASKPGEASASCQDVGWFAPLGASAGDCAAFAVSDGATGGWDGQRWAELLVDAAAAAILADDTTGRLDARWVRSTFADHLDRARVRWVADGPAADADDPVGVLARTKFLSTGGHATLIVGVVGMTPGGIGRLSGFAVGDSVLVHLRRTTAGLSVRGTAPLEHSDEFGAQPDLISSRPPGPGAVVPGLVPIELTDVRTGDCVLVMTDALAAWALRRHEHGKPVWDLLERLDHARFGAIVERARHADEMVSDDVLMLRMCISEVSFDRTFATVANGVGGTDDPTNEGART